MVILGSLVVVQRGHTVVVRFLGDYVGKVLRAGTLWHLPITIRRTVSIAVRNFEANCPRGDDALVRRATDKFRSLRAQVEMVPPHAVECAGRMPKQVGAPSPRRRAATEWSIALTCRDNRELAVPAPAGTGGRRMARGGSA